MKSTFIAFLLILSTSYASTAKQPLVISDKFSSVQFQIHKLLKKYGYTIVETQTVTDAHKHEYHYTTIEADTLSPFYIQFLNELFQLSQVNSVRYRGQDFGDSEIITLGLARSISEQDYVSILQTLQAAGAWILRGHREIAISVPIFETEKFLEILANLNIFSKYTQNSSFPPQSKYFADRERTGFYDLTLAIDVKLNPIFILDQISRTVQNQVVSINPTKNHTEVVIRVPNNLSLIDKLHFSFFFDIQGVKILNLPNELKYQEARILRTHSSLIFIPHNIQNFLAKNNVKQTENELDQIATRLQSFGLDIIGFNISPEMGEGYWIDIQFKAPNFELDLDALSEYGDIFLSDRQYPNRDNQLVSCKGYFSR